MSIDLEPTRPMGRMYLRIAMSAAERLHSETAMHQILENTDAAAATMPVEQFTAIQSVIKGAMPSAEDAKIDPERCERLRQIRCSASEALETIAHTLYITQHPVESLMAATMAATREELPEDKRDLSMIRRAAVRASAVSPVATVAALLQPSGDLPGAKPQQCEAFTASLAPQYVESAMQADYWATRSVVETARNHIETPAIADVAETAFQSLVLNRHKYASPNARPQGFKHT